LFDKLPQAYHNTKFAGLQGLEKKDEKGVAICIQ
jgi:hypothetical protein